jgi:hypothetical protein
MKLDLLTNAGVVEDAIRFVNEKTSNLKTKTSIQEDKGQSVKNISINKIF